MDPNEPHPRTRSDAPPPVIRGRGFTQSFGRGRRLGFDSRGQLLRCSDRTSDRGGSDAAIKSSLPRTRPDHLTGLAEYGNRPTVAVQPLRRRADRAARKTSDPRNQRVRDFAATRNGVPTASTRATRVADDVAEAPSVGHTSETRKVPTRGPPFGRRSIYRASRQRLHSTQIVVS